MIVGGVDYDTQRVAFCILRERSATTFSISYRDKTEDAFRSVAKIPKLMELAIWDHVDVWWIEHAFGKGPTDFKLGRVQGAIVCGLRANFGDVAVNEAGPPEWKKGIGLPGNAAKADYLPQLRLKLTLDFNHDADVQVTEHELDAFGVALYGRTANARMFAT